MFEFVGARLLKAEHLAALGIDTGHDVADGAVLAASVHSLKNQQHRIAVRGVVKTLQRAQFLDVFFEEFLILALGFSNALHGRRPLCEVYFFLRAAPGNPSS